MFKKRRSLLAIVMIMVMIISQSVVLAEEVDSYAVKIEGAGIKSELKLTIADLKAMAVEAQIQESYIYNSKTGEKSVEVKGVSLAYLLKEKTELGVKNAEVVFEASDGYAIDPQELQDILKEELKYVLAYEINGEELEEVTIYRKQKEEGEFNTVFKMINKITVGEATEPTEEVEDKEEADVEEETETTEDITFTDITEEYKFAESAIKDLAKRGIIDGMGDGLYAPEGELTRAQFCKIVVESLGYEKSQYTDGFSDVKSGNWAAEYIQTAIDKGLFKGYTDGSFRPNEKINREQMATVAARAAVIAEKPGSEKLEKFVMRKSDYLDKDDVSSWAENGVAWLEAEKVFVGIASENFYPTKVVNRAEAALIIYNTLFK